MHIVAKPVDMDGGERTARAISGKDLEDRRDAFGARDVPTRHLDSRILCCHDAEAMRTTVTLDPDVQRLLAEKARRSRQSFKQTLNDAIRSGLTGASSQRASSSFKVKARRLGVKAGLDHARLAEIGDDLELERFLSVTRHLAQSQQQPPR